MKELSEFFPEIGIASDFQICNIKSCLLNRIIAIPLNNLQAYSLQARSFFRQRCETAGSTQSAFQSENFKYV